MKPSSGGCAPESTFISVLLPAPFSPTSASTSPARTKRSTPSSATVAPKRFRTPSMRKSSADEAMRLLEQFLNLGSVHVFRRDQSHAAIHILRHFLPAQVGHHRPHR